MKLSAPSRASVWRAVAAPIVISLTVLVVFLTAPPSLADTPAPQTPSWLAQGGTGLPRPEAPRSTWRSVLFLGVAVALGGAAVYLRRHRRARVPSSLPRLSVLESTRVGPKAHLVLANVGGRVLLLGVTDTSIRRLGSFDEKAPEPKEERTAKDLPRERGRKSDTRKIPANEASAMPFTQVLRGLLPVDARDSGLNSAAAIVARETTDIVETRKRGPVQTTNDVAPSDSESNVNALALEGQAAGLTKRRRRRTT